jgi:hypothetical protein
VSEKSSNIGSEFGVNNSENVPGASFDFDVYTDSGLKVILNGVVELLCVEGSGE